MPKGVLEPRLLIRGFAEGKVRMDKMLKGITEVYNMFGDDCSKEIYAQRILYSLTNENKYIDNIIRKTLPGQWIESTLAEKNSNNALLFGAGVRGRTLARLYKKYFKAIIDNDPQKRGEEIEGLKVMAISDAVNKYPNAIIVLSIKDDINRVIDDLIGQGISKDNIINAGEMITEMRDGQYFDLPYMLSQDNEVFLDCGAYDGKSSLQFMKWCANKYKHIYCFEPDVNNINLCRQNLMNSVEIGKCTIINKGTWSKSTILEFSKSSDEASHICEGGTEKINVCSIDEELFKKKDERVSFIKMDIEGAELETLKGARHTIMEQMPKLAISIYHKPEDILSIPLYIRSLNTNYTFYLRHYTFAAWDTVLYAIP